MSLACKKIWNNFKENPKVIKIYSLFSAVGIATFLLYRNFSIILKKIYSNPELLDKINNNIKVFPNPFNNIDNITVICLSICCFLSIYIICMYVTMFFKLMCNYFKKIHMSLIGKIDKNEKIEYIALLLFQIIFVIFTYSKTKAVYGDPCFDIIYGMDSWEFFIRNGYIYREYFSIKEILFSLFVTPFMGPYAMLQYIMPKYIAAIIIQLVQLILFNIANILFINLVDFKDKKIKYISIFFIGISYASIIGTLIIEKYIFVYFYLALFIYFRFKDNKILNKKEDFMLPIMASGMLLINMFFVPFISNNKFKENKGKWFTEMVKFVLGMFFITFIFFGVQTFIKIPADIIFQKRFVGYNNSFFQNFYQFVNFIMTCIMAPPSWLITYYGYPAWWLKPVNSINVVGIVLIFVSILGYAFSHKEYISKLSMMWIIFAFALIGVAGWGTANNETSVYILYFAWAIQILIINLFNKLNEKIKYKAIVEICYGIFVICIMILNIYGIRDLLNFALNYYAI